MYSRNGMGTNTSRHADWKFSIVFVTCSSIAISNPGLRLPSLLALLMTYVQVERSISICLTFALQGQTILPMVARGDPL